MIHLPTKIPLSSVSTTNTSVCSSATSSVTVNSVTPQDGIQNIISSPTSHCCCSDKQATTSDPTATITMNQDAPTQDLSHCSNRKSNTIDSAITGSDGAESCFRNPAFAEARRVVSERFLCPSAISTSELDCDLWKSLSCSSRALFHIPKFSKQELALGKRLGKGSFSNVDEIRDIMLCHQHIRQSSKTHMDPSPPSSSTATTTNAVATKTSSSFSAAFKKMVPPGLKREDTVANNNIESRVFMAQHCVRYSGDCRYALKMVRRDVFHSNDQSNVVAGICDLAVETMFLSSLEHPNIIKLRGMADTEHPFTRDYFLVLDRLNDTLQRRIQCTWKTKEKRLYSFWGRLRDRRGRKRLDFFEHRLERAFDLGSAIEYLHKKEIIHRDIKPDNIGFDLRDDIKLFDFGMAKELKQEHKVDDENYRLSFCGSPSYMAPEVWAKLPYNSSCDVYSFGVVLYEMITLRRAFDFCSGSNSDEFAATVFQNDVRPDVNHIRAPKSIKELLPFCWNVNPQYRYDMSNVNLTIRKELILLRRGDESKLPDFTRRRSTFIFQQSERQGGRKSLDGSSKSLAESIQSILSATALPSSRHGDRKRSSVANLDALSLSDHSLLNLSLNSASAKSL